MTATIPTKERIEKALACCMCLSAGYLDGYGLLVLGTYVSFMSGNTTMAGVKAGQASFLAALVPAIAIVAFAAGSGTGAVIKHLRPRHVPQIVLVLTALLAAAVALVGAPAEFKGLDIAILSFGMGMANPVLQKIGGESISLTFMTGTLSRIGTHLALALVGAPVPGAEGEWDTHSHRARMGLALWGSFLIGAALSGAAISVSKNNALWPAVALMLLIALASAFAQPLADSAQPPPTPAKDPVKAAPSQAAERSTREREAAGA